MKLMIASDIHGSAYYCLEMLDAMKKECPDRLLLLGDILYHGPRNDLPLEYEPKKVIKMLNEVKEKLFCVRGNCDTEVDQMVLDFPVMAEYCVIFWGGRTVYATHGHQFHRGNLPPLQRGDILVHGHTHVPGWELFGNENLYLNPGSVSIPKENSAHSYMILEDGLAKWKNLYGEVYHELML